MKRILIHLSNLCLSHSVSLPSENLVLQRKICKKSRSQEILTQHHLLMIFLLSVVHHSLPLLFYPASLSYSFIIFMFVIFVLKGGQDFQSFPVLSLESKLSSLLKTFFSQIFRLIPEVAFSSFLFHSFPFSDLHLDLLTYSHHHHQVSPSLVSLLSLSCLSHSFCIRRSSSGKFLMPFHHFL